MKKFEASDTAAAQALRKEKEGLNREEQAKFMLNLVMPMQGMAGFYATLVQDQLDPAHYGDKVTPLDASLVLLRWQTAEGTYQVILGDLHIETVTATQLVELEAALPH